MSSDRHPGVQAPSSVELFAAIPHGRLAVFGVAVFSGLINLLALTGSLYMLQLYDRVIPAHSVPTLIGLSVLMLVLYAGFGLFEWVRSRVMGRIALQLDRSLRARVFGVVMALPLRTRAEGDGLLPVRDLDRLRAFLGGPGPMALFDLPWMPLYLGLVYLLHPWLGLLALAGACVLVGLTILTEMRSRAPTRSASVSGAAREVFLEATRRNAEVVQALGMSGRLSALWSNLNEKHLGDQLFAADIAGSYGTMSRVLRFVVQSAVLGLGAYLVIDGEATGGVMIAASILTSRALAPVELVIANWRGFLSARQSATRLRRFLAAYPARSESLKLPKPSKSLLVEGLWIAAPGHQGPIVKNVSFGLDAGMALGVIGPSASGKSTLARAVVGAWPALRGSIRLDVAALDQWSADALGRHIGYLPQDIELFDGSVAQNISRFKPDVPAAEVIAAAAAAGVHDMILRLPDGYETKIGEGGATLSAGQRQRVALARALYGDPFLIVLDEPNSNLDAEGDAALTRAIVTARARGAIVIVIAHRPAALSGCDKVLVMGDGQLQAFGPKEEVLRKVLQPAPEASQNPARLKVVSESKQEVL